MSFPTASAVGYLVPSLRDFEQNHHKAKAEGNSSRHAKNLRVSSIEARAEREGEDLRGEPYYCSRK